jgi:putative transposase
MSHFLVPLPIRAKTYRYKLQPTAAQEEQLGQWLGATRFAYNLALDYKRYLYAAHGKRISKYGLRDQLTDAAKEANWLAALPYNTLDLVSEQVTGAYEKFFKGAGYPRFANRDSWRSIPFRQNIHVDAARQTVTLPKFGAIPLVLHRPVGGRIKQARVTKEADGWYVCLSCEEAIAPLPPTTHQVGVDVGIKALATLNTGEVIENPRHLLKAQHKLRRLQRAVSRKKKGGANRRKAIDKLARQHQKVRNTRKDHLHQLTTRLIRENQVIAVEDLRVKNLVQHPTLAKHISDAGWGLLVQQLEYKATWYGRELVKVAPHYTSRDCSVCGYRLPELDLKTRAWTCPTCGTQHDRDANAASNVLARATT